MLKIVKGLFTNKKFDLDNDGKIESYREEIKGVFSQFVIMNDKLEDVNSKLKGVIEDEKFAQDCEKDNLERLIKLSNGKIEEAEKRIELANAEIESNNKLQEKVKNFIL